METQILKTLNKRLAEARGVLASHSRKALIREWSALEGFDEAAAIAREVIVESELDAEKHLAIAGLNVIIENADKSIAEKNAEIARLQRILDAVHTSDLAKLNTYRRDDSA